MKALSDYLLEVFYKQFHAHPLLQGQVLLLCSDGLNDALSADQIADILAGEMSLAPRCQQLVSAALEAGGRDNVTVLLLEGRPNLVLLEGAPEPEIVWRYNPVTAGYEGLPEQVAQPTAEVTRVAPRVLDDTVLTKPPTPMNGDGGSHYRWLILALVGAVLIFFSFSVDGFW